MLMTGKCVRVLQGVILKITDDGRCLVGRILHGGLMHKLGKRDVFDVIFCTTNWTILNWLWLSCHAADYSVLCLYASSRRVLSMKLFLDSYQDLTGHGC